MAFGRKCEQLTYYRVGCVGAEITTFGGVVAGMWSRKESHQQCNRDALHKVAGGKVIIGNNLT
jgi:hypothetical protein